MIFSFIQSYFENVVNDKPFLINPTPILTIDNYYLSLPGKVQNGGNNNLILTIYSRILTQLPQTIGRIRIIFVNCSDQLLVTFYLHYDENSAIHAATA
jgi:hypothetical protein